MRLSVILPLDVPMATTCARAALAEAAGFDTVFVPDHLTGGTFFTSGVWHGSLTSLEQIRAATHAIPIGPLVGSAVLRPAATLAVELASLGRDGRVIRAGIGSGADRDAALTGTERPDSAGLEAYARAVAPHVAEVLVAANVGSRVRAAAAVGQGWVTTGGLRVTGAAKLATFQRLRAVWHDEGGGASVAVLIDPHEASPWSSAHTMRETLTTWRDAGASEVVVWPPEAYADTAGIDYADAAALR